MSDQKSPLKAKWRPRFIPIVNVDALNGCGAIPAVTAWGHPKRRRGCHRAPKASQQRAPPPPISMCMPFDAAINHFFQAGQGYIATAMETF